jgi:hypothetical protein
MPNGFTRILRESRRRIRENERRKRFNNRRRAYHGLKNKEEREVETSESSHPFSFSQTSPEM